MNAKTTLKKVKGNFERLFDKNLTDLVRGIRNNKDNEAKYISQCLEEIKEELKQENKAVKTNAVAKLAYLQMLGYDICWSSFNIIEVMSSTKFTFKRIGYLAASQCFNENTEVLMLTTNMVRKDLNSHNMYDAGCAMSGLSCFVSPDLSRDLANDVMIMLTSTKPYLRKKAVLLMYKIFLKFPEALKPAFPRLKEKLEDPDPGVQSAAVNVICELARKNPKNYLPLAPIFFKLMTNSSNNWMLIKIVKLFGALTPLEPRLGKKLIEPLTNLIHSTSAMSLLYECINTVIAVLISISSGLPNHNASIQLCVQKLRILIEDSDQNLKYLGLLAMSKILKTHPKSVQAHKDLVLACLDDKDESIRLRALDLLYGMVSKKNLMDIIRKLMINVNQSQLGNKYRDELIVKIIDICSQNDYQMVTNFEWYVSVLVELSRVEGGTDHGKLIAQQMLDVAIRVDAIRPFACKQMSILLENCYLFASSNSVSEVLYAAAWICGEFASFLEDKRSVLLSMLTPSNFPAHIEAVFLQNASKLFTKIIKEEPNSDDIKELGRSICDLLSPFLVSDDLEVQERATSFLEIINFISNENDDADFESMFYSYVLNPVASVAQRKVPVPVGLNLDVPFDVIVGESDDEDLEVNDIDEQNVRENKFMDQESDEESYQNYQSNLGEKEEESQSYKRHQKENNPNYLKMDKLKKKAKNLPELEEAEEVLPEIKIKEKKTIQASDLIPGLVSSEKYIKKGVKTKKKGKKEKTVKEDEGDEVHHELTIKGLEMPEGATFNEIDDENEDEFNGVDDPHKALSKIVIEDRKLIGGKNEKEKKKMGKTKNTVRFEGNDEIVEEKKKAKQKSKIKKSKKLNNENDIVNESTKKIKKKKPPQMLDLEDESGEKKKKKKKVKSITDINLINGRKRNEYLETIGGIDTPSAQSANLVPGIPSENVESLAEDTQSLNKDVVSYVDVENNKS